MRTLSRTTVIVRRVLDAVLIALILVVLFGVILGKVVPLTGRQTIIIGGESMEPAIHIGPAIIVAPVAAADLLASPLAGYLIALLSIPAGVLFLIGLAATLLAAVWRLESLELDSL